MKGQRGKSHPAARFFGKRYAWIDKLKTGDVVRFKSGALRTVLRATYHDDGTLNSALFTFLHCSWTKRPYTNIDRSQLAARAECLTNARVNIAKHPAAMIALADNEVRGLDAKGRPRRVGTCCDVIGVFE